MHWKCLAWVFPVTSAIWCSGNAFPLSQVDVSVYHQVPAGRNSTYRHDAADSGEERPKCLTISSRAVGFTENACIPQRNEISYLLHSVCLVGFLSRSRTRSECYVRAKLGQHFRTTDYFWYDKTLENLNMLMLSAPDCHEVTPLQTAQNTFSRPYAVNRILLASVVQHGPQQITIRSL